MVFGLFKKKNILASKDFFKDNKSNIAKSLGIISVLVATHAALLFGVKKLDQIDVEKYSTQVISMKQKIHVEDEKVSLIKLEIKKVMFHEKESQKCLDEFKFKESLKHLDLAKDLCVTIANDFGKLKYFEYNLFLETKSNSLSVSSNSGEFEKRKKEIVDFEIEMAKMSKKFKTLSDYYFKKAHYLINKSERINMSFYDLVADTDVKLITDMVYSEVGIYGNYKSQKYKDIIAMIASTVYNRRSYQSREFGKNIRDIIYKNGSYYGVSTKRFNKARSLDFKIRKDYISYLNIYKIVKKVSRGELHFKGDFYFTDSEINYIMKRKNSKKVFDLDKIEFIKKLGKYKVFIYKVSVKKKPKDYLLASN